MCQNSPLLQPDVRPNHPNHFLASDIFRCFNLPDNHKVTCDNADISHDATDVHGPLTRYNIGHYSNFNLGSDAMEHFLAWCDHFNVPMPTKSSFELAGGGDTYMFEVIHYKEATASRGPATLATPRYFVRHSEDNLAYVELHNYFLGGHRLANLKLKKQVILCCERDHTDGHRIWEVNMLGTD